MSARNCSRSPLWASPYWRERHKFAREHPPPSPRDVWVGGVTPKRKRTPDEVQRTAAPRRRTGPLRLNGAPPRPRSSPSFPIRPRRNSTTHPALTPAPHAVTPFSIPQVPSAHHAPHTNYDMSRLVLYTAAIDLAPAPRAGEGSITWSRARCNVRIPRWLGKLTARHPAATPLSPAPLGGV